MGLERAAVTAATQMRLEPDSPERASLLSNLDEPLNRSV
jgi:hypothetical protein